MRVALPSCRYKMGEIFVEVSKDEAEQLLEKATSKLSEVACLLLADGGVALGFFSEMADVPSLSLFSSMR
jgi:hypothetical protein